MAQLQPIAKERWNPLSVELFHLHYPIILLMHMVNGYQGEFSLRLGQYKLAIPEFLSNIRVGCIQTTHISYMNRHPSGIVSVV